MQAIEEQTFLLRDLSRSHAGKFKIGFVLIMPTDAFKVQVRSNTVLSITGVASDEVAPGLDINNPLAVSTELADNNKKNGNLDGDYFLGTFIDARDFACLCIGFQQALCDKSLESVQNAGSDGSQSWVNRFVPTAGSGQAD